MINIVKLGFLPLQHNLAHQVHTEQERHRMLGGRRLLDHPLCVIVGKLGLRAAKWLVRSHRGRQEQSWGCNPGLLASGLRSPWWAWPWGFCQDLVNKRPRGSFSLSLSPWASLSSTESPLLSLLMTHDSCWEVASFFLVKLWHLLPFIGGWIWVGRSKHVPPKQYNVTSLETLIKEKKL